jgi:hypothetical protein
VTELASTNYFQINYLQKEDAGIYECIIRTEYGEGSETFEIKMGDDEVDDKDSTDSNKPTITPFNLKKHSIKFNFVELSLRPAGRVVVLCESGKLSCKIVLMKTF